jgi:hypothetical protein
VSLPVDLSLPDHLGALVTEYLWWRSERLDLGAALSRLRDAATADERYERELAQAKLAGNSVCLVCVRDDLRRLGVDISAFLRWSDDRERARG